MFLRQRERSNEEACIGESNGFHQSRSFCAAGIWHLKLYVLILPNHAGGLCCDHHTPPDFSFLEVEVVIHSMSAKRWDSHQRLAPGPKAFE